jgi:hypothetical protein
MRRELAFIDWRWLVLDRPDNRTCSEEKSSTGPHGLASDYFDTGCRKGAVAGSDQRSKKQAASAVEARVLASTAEVSHGYHCPTPGCCRKQHARKAKFREAIQADLGGPVPALKILRLCRRANRIH